MDLNEFRSMILDSGHDIWGLIDTAITLASSDHENELKQRRDGIVQKLYAASFSVCGNCSGKVSEGIREEKDEEGEGDEEERKILEIKILLDEQNKSEMSLIELLQRLVDMDTSFKTLKSTDIGRHVSKLRKHSSAEVRKLVKILIRKWKDTVDEWVRWNAQTEQATPLDDDEPHYESLHNGHLTPLKIESDHKSPSAKKHPLDQNCHQTQHVEAKKQRTAQALHFNSIPKTKNPIIS